MKRAYVRLLEAVILLALIVMLVAELPARVFRLTRGRDFKSALDDAKRKVYPALVYVKPTDKDVAGTGMIISPDGRVVTHNHLVAGAEEINCVLYSHRQLSATLVGSDSQTDLALLKLQLPPGSAPLPQVEFADSDRLEQGEFVLAVGSPVGFSRSISLGIVSNTERYLGDDTGCGLHNWIETDACINADNDGGALVNTEGKVIGINTLIPALSGSAGFAIPANVVRQVCTRLGKEGKVVRAWLGLELRPLKDYRRSLLIDSDSGALIGAVEPHSPAAQAGLQAGDVLVEVKGKNVTAIYVEELPKVRRILADLAPTKEVRLVVKRGADVLEFTVVPTEEPN